MTGRYFTEQDYCSGPPITPERIAEVEALTGFRLPRAYVDLLAERNGGVLVRDAFMTGFPSTWGGTFFQVGVLCGIGPGPDTYTVLSSGYMIDEWGLPVTGLLISCTPSNHDWVLLDYGTCGPQGEPSVVYIDESIEGDADAYVVHEVAPDFATFLNALVKAPADDDGHS